MLPATGVRAAASSASAEPLQPAPPTPVQVPTGAPEYLGSGLRLAQAPVQAADGGAARTRGEEPGLFDDVKMEFAPLRWGGRLLGENRLQRTTTGSQTVTHLNAIELQGATYLWQPWFAQLSGSLGLLYDVSKFRSPNQPSRRSETLNPTGSVNLFLFPMSRFPFNAYLNVSDSRTSDEITTTDYRNTRFGVRQDYRTADGSANYYGRYEHSTLSSAAFADDVLDVGEVGLRKTLGPHSFEANGSASDNRGGQGGTRTQKLRGYARHYYRPDVNASLETIASIDDFLTQSLGARTETRSLQLTSYGTWSPVEGDRLYREGSRLLITGSARLFALQSEADATRTDSHSVNASLGMNYAITPEWSVNASGSVAQSASGSSSIFTSSQNASVLYTPAPKPLGDFTLSWSASANAANTTATGQGSTPVVGGSAQYTLQRPYQLAERSTLTFSFGQGVATAVGRDTNTSALNNNAGVTWSSSSESGGLTLMSLTASDSRSFGDRSGSFQLVNLQATRQDALGGRSYWTGNLTIQGTRQDRSGEPSTTTVSASGSASYFHNRAFNVPRLRFTATFTANASQFSTRAEGDIEAQRDPVTASLEGRFDYTIGLLDLRLSALTTRAAAGERTDLIFLRTVRRF